MNHTNFAEYIWLDGDQPTQGIRSKARVVQVPFEPTPEDFPDWSFDGSSTSQADGDDSDCLLEPETCDIKAFKAGVAHRGASVRIPRPVAVKGSGYIEDRRPGANADPYRVATCLVDTVCGAEAMSRVA